jgi:hypothetical protein
MRAVGGSSIRTAPGIALALMLVWSAGCSGEAGRPGAGPTEVSGSPNVQPDAEDVAAVEEAVRDYLEAFRESDFMEWKRLSAGELAELADWSALVTANNPSSSRDLEIESLEVESVQEPAATVQLEATFNETFVDPLSGGDDSYTLDLSGPVQLVKEASGWKVADIYRDGRSRLESVFTRVRGRQERNGVTVEVTGVDLRPDTTVVVVQIRNTLDEAIDLDFDAAMVTSNGRQFGSGQPASQLEIAPEARLEEAYYWSNASLPLSTSEFRLLLEFFTGGSFDEVSFDIPVRLID